MGSLALSETSAARPTEYALLCRSNMPGALRMPVRSPIEHFQVRNLGGAWRPPASIPTFAVLDIFPPEPPEPLEELGKRGRFPLAQNSLLQTFPVLNIQWQS